MAGVKFNPEQTVTGDAYISWAINNTGPNTLNSLFYVDLYFDGVVVERWGNQGLSTNFFSFVDGWNELRSRVRVHSGLHTLKLVVDSTNLVPERNENDNVFERVYVWEPTGLAAPDPTPVPTRLPDLVPFVPDGWSGPVIATSYPESFVDGPLSVSTPSYIRYSMHNAGLSSAPEDVWGHLFLDDVLVEMDFWLGVLADGTVERPEWSGLFEVANVSSGPHTLRVVLDPGDLVSELDEENNWFEKEFNWGTGPVPPMAASVPEPEPTPPAPLTLPNLVPGWKFGWDGPIVVSHGTDTFLDGPLTVDEMPFVDVIIFNQSSVAATDPFSVDLYFDGEVVHTFEFPGPTEPGTLRWRQDWGSLAESADITEGDHSLKIVIDSGNGVEEANEDDNVYEKTLLWATGTPADVAPTTYSEEELRDMLAGLQALLDTRGPATGSVGKDFTQEILNVADAGYYLLTGRSIKDERVDIGLLARDEYLDWIDESYIEDFALDDGSQYPAILDAREEIKLQALGLKTRRFGQVALVVDAEHSVADVVNTLAHELGHMLQDFLAPQQTEAEPFYFLDAIQEAEAQQFERAFWLSLEEFTGLTLLAYPNYEAFQSLVDEGLDFWILDAENDAHSLGSLLQWLAVYNDPELQVLLQELLAGGELSAPSALVLYEYLVGIEPESVHRYVAARLGALGAVLQAVRATSKGRLVPALHPDNEGSPYLRVPALLMP